MSDLDAGTARSQEPALCVLGCRPGSRAFVRRARAASEAYGRIGRGVVVACGGRSWSGRVEADELARLLSDGGVPERAIVRERASRDTRQNARFAARLLASRGVGRVILVTCSWHLARATMLFEAQGLRVVEGVGVDPPDSTALLRAWWAARERVSTWKDRLRGLGPEVT